MSFNTGLFVLFMVSLTESQFLEGLLSQYKGCFQEDVSKRDFPYQVQNFPSSFLVTQNCVQSCADKYFLYAGLQNGELCFCGNSFGSHGQGQCKLKCRSNEAEICGDVLANSVYETGVNVPGPPANVGLEKSSENSLTIKWSPPLFSDHLEDFITDYFIHVAVNFSYDDSHNSRTFSPKEIQMSKTSRMTTILGLRPGSLYNVSVSAASKNGQGNAASALFWTEIGDPVAPKAPTLVHHNELHDHHNDDHDHEEFEGGELHVHLEGSDQNKYGPISKYRILVIDETDPAPFEKSMIFGYQKAMANGLHYYITAELENTFFDHGPLEFVVGDNNTYGGYLNFGPLARGRDYHVTLGVVSTLNNVEKVTYAKVTHDQHALENVFVFEFHDMHDHHDNARDDSAPDQALAIGLSVAIVVLSVVFCSFLAFYGYLRWMTCRRHGRGHGGSSRGDAQELTAHISSVDAEGGFNLAFDNDNVDDVKFVGQELNIIRGKVWSIPRNFLELTHEVIGRGKFGSLVKGNVNKRGSVEPVNIQVVPGKILEDSEMQGMVKDLDLVVSYGSHPNLIQIIGLCEDKDTIFVVFEQAWPTLKQALLDSRALVHYPAFVESHGKFSTLREEVIVNMMLGIAKGMDHLASLGIMHKKLCARNIFLALDQPKIGAVGIVDYSRPRQELDLTRWTAQEALKSTNYVWKCDVWSLGVVFWECLTLGATPYADVPNRDVQMRVMRGLRLHQPNFVSEEFYQMMLQCWQIDLDERPSFGEIVTFLQEMVHEGHIPINFGVFPNFTYDAFSSDLELQPSYD